MVIIDAKLSKRFLKPIRLTSKHASGRLLKKAIKNVTKMCEEARIQITATVCDQGSTKVKPIDELVKETDRK